MKIFIIFAESGGEHDMMPTTQLQQKRQPIYCFILYHRVFERKFLENITFFVTEINTQQKIGLLDIKIYFKKNYC